ncbi:histidine ammonia-lyase [Thermotomaculum hydrothermale]|uniref:Histidine ammonia-lyase n=1 Tax=Thermotomaculum hydrothermale TaxID=981385 RepID=A0A7R6SZG0_9BACT|nr:histidine ammonia-lyase [Thermotomaculum hydrothermale]BBB33616.1 histidine ammonia-lyase [Thermotomaculum hydrothermale]
MREVVLTGNDLNLRDLIDIGFKKAKVVLSKEAREKVKRGRAVVDKIVEENRVVYGVTTGFGQFASVVIPQKDVEELQYNLIRSHAAGVGDYLPEEIARMLMALRANVLAKGRSGISLETLELLIEMINRGVYPLIPEKGSVGASGDLAPLAHLALVLIGEGKARIEDVEGTGEEILKIVGLKPVRLRAKEGLALINGTQVMTAIGALALYKAKNLIKHADLIGALSLEALKGTKTAFDERIHRERLYKGQRDSAKNLWNLLQDSEIMESHKNCGKVQDAYSLRCMPQVHGPVRDTVEYVEKMLEIEMNSATDNPMVFEEQNELISGGNFHGESVAFLMDFLKIAVAELGNISERRIERLVNPALSELPAFLVEQGGLNSGFMLAHVTAAALVSENKVLCHPASVDSIPTSANKEDHVSMGTIAARKALEVVNNVENILSIELMAACQGLEFLKPLKPAKALIPVYQKVRENIAPWDKDRYMADDIEKARKLVESRALLDIVEKQIGKLN